MTSCRRDADDGRAAGAVVFYCVLVSICAAYSPAALSAGAHYLSVFRSRARRRLRLFRGSGRIDLVQESWSTTLKNTFDGLVYGLLTGGTFGGCGRTDRTAAVV